MKSTELYHYGVLGMKWGVRRYQPYSTTGRRKSGKSGKEVGEAKKLSRRQQISRMSDNELRERSNRIEAENRYYNLTKTSKERLIDRSRKVTADAITELAKETAKRSAAKYLSRGIDSIVRGLTTEKATNDILESIKNYSMSNDSWFED